jgi:hypothetical protein
MQRGLAEFAETDAEELLCEASTDDEAAGICGRPALRGRKGRRVGAKNKRLKAGRNPEYLIKVLLSPVLVK